MDEIIKSIKKEITRVETEWVGNARELYHYVQGLNFALKIINKEKR